MSETTKKREILNELDFLNGEVGRIKILKQAIEDEISEIEVVKATKHNEFLVDSNDKQNQIEKFEKLIDTKRKEYEVACCDSEKLTYYTALTKDELKSYEVALENAKLNAQEVEKNIGQQKEALRAVEVSLKKREEQVKLSEHTLIAKEEGFKLRLENHKNAEVALEKEKISFEKLKKETQLKFEQSEEAKRTYNGKIIELEKTETTLRHEKEQFNQEKEIILQKEAQNIKIVAEIVQRDAELRAKEQESVKRVVEITQRETNVILREAECRIREKQMSIVQREQQLKD